MPHLRLYDPVMDRELLNLESNLFKTENRELGYESPNSHQVQDAYNHHLCSFWRRVILYEWLEHWILSTFGRILEIKINSLHSLNI